MWKFALMAHRVCPESSFIYESVCLGIFWTSNEEDSRARLGHILHQGPFAMYELRRVRKKQEKERFSYFHQEAAEFVKVGCPFVALRQYLGVSPLKEDVR